MSQVVVVQPTTPGHRAHVPLNLLGGGGCRSWGVLTAVEACRDRQCPERTSATSEHGKITSLCTRKPSRKLGFIFFLMWTFPLFKFSFSIQINKTLLLQKFC